MGMIQKGFIGAYLEPGIITEKGVNAVLDCYQREALVSNLFFRAYGPFYRDPSPKGGACFTIHPQLYEGTFSRDFQAKETGDLLTPILEEAGRRGMGVYAYFFPSKTPPITVDGYERVLEQDVFENPGPHTCWRNPDYRSHLLGAARDILTNYPVLGLMWGAERCGPLGWTILTGPTGGKPTCFCNHCCAAAVKAGIDTEKAKKGWLQVVELFSNIRAGGIPPEGVFINFWRILLRFPEILVWERFWWEGKQTVQKEIFAMTKSIRPGLKMGYHLWHRGRAFSPFNRAAQDYDELCGYADFVKPAMFSNPAGFRFKEQVDGLKASILADLDSSEVADVLFHLLHYDRECKYDELTAHAFSPRYVYKEVEMARKIINGRIPIYAGICSGTYTRYPGIRQRTHEDIAGDLRAAKQAGADGVIFDSVGMPHMASAVGNALKHEGWL